MTFRAVLLGLVGAAALNGVTYFNDFVLRQSHFVGSFLPISVFGGLIVFTVLINPLLGRIRGRLSLRGSELAVVVLLIFAACYVPGRGLLHYFTTLQMLPHKYQEDNVPWKHANIVSVAPERMLADPSGDREQALGGYWRGLGKAGSEIGLGEVPWHAWARSLAFWMPLLLSLLIGMIGLSLVLHRQWAHHERLRYPIATFANALLPRPGRTAGPVLKSHLFWLAALGVMGIHLVNYVYQWYPQEMVQIPVVVNFAALKDKVPTFTKWGGGTDLLIFKVYFAAVGFAYILSTDISISMGIAPFLYTYVAGVLILHGIPVREGGILAPSQEKFLHAGAYFGTFLVLLYVGRRYYLDVLRRAFFLPGRSRAPKEAVWGARVFLTGSILFVLQLALVGLDWQLAALYTIATVMVFVVVSRIVAETGLFYLHAYTFPCVLLWGFMGPAALGPKMLVIMMLVSSALLIDPREALLPFVMQGLHLADATKVKVGKTAVWVALALVVAFAVGVPATLYWQYDKGVAPGKASDGWTVSVPRFAFDNALKIRDKLHGTGDLARAESLRGWERFAEISPDWPLVIGFLIAMGLVLLFTAARLRFARWPLHPIMFLVLAMYQIRRLGFSFLLGGLIKIAITRLFGSRGYEKAKPAMFGLVAGEMLAGIVTMIIGAIYYFRTGASPKSFMILPW